MSLPLPDFARYKNAYLQKGINFPLPAVEFNSDGLLIKLPAVNENKNGWPWTDEVDAGIYDKSISWPKLTIVTPSYNQAAYLEETIRAVLLQNYPNLEYIIMDGGSTDGSVEIIKKYSPWISYWQSEKDRGQSHAINMGFSLASGDYRAWINSDDYYLKNVFHQVIENFLKESTDFIYGYGYNFNVLKKQFQLITVLPLLDYFIRIPSLVQPSCFWFAGIQQPICEELQCSLDYELWLRMVKGKKRKLIKKPLSVANEHDEAKTSNPKMKAAWEKDHLLICSQEAHGPVNDWNKRMFLYKIYKRLNSLMGQMKS